MLKFKIILSFSIFSLLLIGTSLIKNETREIEKKIYIKSKKIFLKEKNLNETQLDFFYLSSPSIIEKKIKYIGTKQYFPMEFSKIFLSISDLQNLKNKFATNQNQYEKKD